MGADIHVFIERKTIKKDDPQLTEWISIDEWVHNPYMDEKEIRNPYWKELLEYDWQQNFKDDNNEVFPLREMVIPFVDEFIPCLIKLDEPENIRMVFWFDN